MRRFSVGLLAFYFPDNLELYRDDGLGGWHPPPGRGTLDEILFNLHERGV